jgi:6-pyruvoyltetrahydropterin/6-carboxytetrahydropterin synthase
MHGHNYRVDFAISGNLNKYGFVCDFAHIDDDVLPLIKKLDHRVINEIIENPTAEIIAQWFFEHLLIYDLVRVYENDDSWAEVSK